MKGKRRNGDSIPLTQEAGVPTGLVSDRIFFERILHERRRGHDSEHDGHDNEHEAHDEQHQREQQAMEFARRTLESKVEDAEKGVAERHATVVDRLDKLESGGAPFASRLDESLTTLKTDVDLLKTGAVRQETVDALNKRQQEDAASQKKQIRNIFIAAALSFAFSLILAGVLIAVQLGGTNGT